MGQQKTKQDGVMIETVHDSTWECGRNGRSVNQNARMDVRIVTHRHIASDTRENVGWTCEPYIQVGESWVMIGGVEDRVHDRIRAFDRAALKIIDRLYDNYAELLDLGGHEKTEESRSLLYVVRAELTMEMGRISEKAKPEFKHVEGNDLHQCLVIAAEFFEKLDKTANIHWRFRVPADGEPWASGKDQMGHPALLGGKVEKCSEEKAGLIAETLNWKPDFIITICHETWSEMQDSEDRLKSLIHHLLCQCGYDQESLKFFVAKPDVSAFSGTVREFGLTSIKDTLFVRAAIKGASDNGQLEQMDLFQSVPINGVHTIAVKRIQKALRPGNSVCITGNGSTDVVITSESVSGVI
jgi:hypothetical protein